MAAELALEYDHNDYCRTRPIPRPLIAARRIPMCGGRPSMATVSSVRIAGDQPVAGNRAGQRRLTRDLVFSVADMNVFRPLINDAGVIRRSLVPVAGRRHRARSAASSARRPRHANLPLTYHPSIPHCVSCRPEKNLLATAEVRKESCLALAIRIDCSSATADPAQNWTGSQSSTGEGESSMNIRHAGSRWLDSALRNRGRIKRITSRLPR